jgi:hypothetical protein
MFCQNHPDVAVRPDNPLPLCTTCLEEWARAQSSSRFSERNDSPNQAESPSRVGLAHWIRR